MELKGSKIIITGGSKGIGRAMAKMLIREGAEVVITGRNASVLRAAAEETGAYDIVADVSKPSDIERTYEQALDRLGGLDCLINNAGIGWSKPLTEVSLEDFEKIYAVNVYGVALMTKKAAEIFIQQHYGHIVNIGSTASRKGFIGGTVYASSKFALRGMTECWREELRPYNVRVMIINPSEATSIFGGHDRKERDAESKSLRSEEIAHAVRSALEMDDRGFTTELTVWATNPW